jgi:hypothetical protein
MKKIVFLLLASAFLLTSCIDMMEEIYLNRDGSGKYSLTFDMSGLFSDPMMKGMIEEMMSEGGVSSQFTDTDTVIYFRDLPAEERQKMSNPKLWEKAMMRLTMSESEEKMMSVMEFEFDKLDDIASFYSDLSKLGEGGADMTGGMMGEGGMLTSLGAAAYSLKGKKLTRSAPDVSNKENQEEDEEMAFIKMFLASGSYASVYHLPGNVKKTNIPGAVIDGKTVTVRNSLMDVMDGKANTNGEIRFK